MSSKSKVHMYYTVSYNSNANGPFSGIGVLMTFLILKRIKYFLDIDGNSIQNNICNVINFNLLFVTEIQSIE